MAASTAGWGLLSLFQTTPTSVLDSGATSSFQRPGDGAVPTGQPSDKVVGMPDGHVIQTTEKALLPQTQLRPEARDSDILPSLSHNSLISVGKLADAGYVTLFMPGGDGVEVYDERDIKFVVSGEAVLRGWRDKDRLWRVPMQDGVLPPGKSPHQLPWDVNNCGTSSTTSSTCHQLSRVFDLSTHAAVFRLKQLGSKQSANFVGWPLVTVENVNKYFPESEETQKGHMNHQRQDVRSTKPKSVDFEEVDKSLTFGLREKDV